MREEIPIIPEEDVPRREKRIPTEKERKGIIDINTYNQLKGLLGTSKVVLGNVPLVGAKKSDIETINHLESLTDNAISVLENINVTEIPKKISPIPEMIKRTEIDKIIKVMRNRLYDADKLIKDCDSRSIIAMSEASGYMERNKEKYGDLLTSEPDYRKLVKYSKELNRFFTDLCECKPLKKR